MKINITQVAKKAGVSIATVSRAFQTDGTVKEETRKRVLEVARELNYKPSPIARGLSTQKTDTIGVILPDLVGEFFMDIIHGIDEEAHSADKYILVSSSHNQRDITETLLEFISSGRVDGIILMAPKTQKDIIDLIKKSKRPVVLMNASGDLNDVVNFQFDNHQGAYNSVCHLISHGYKDIAIVRGPVDNWDAEERYNGYKDALKSHGLSANPAFCVNGDFSIKSGYYSFMRLMSLREKPGAIFFSNDMMALGAYDAARNSNIKIPQDIAVTGFDDIFLSRLLNPRLTTIHVPITELGSRAVKYLLKMISNEVDPHKPYNAVLSTGLVIGGSCGCTFNNSSIGSVTDH
jgi:LacI family transcriptional regulator